MGVVSKGIIVTLHPFRLWSSWVKVECLYSPPPVSLGIRDIGLILLRFGGQWLNAVRLAPHQTLTLYSGTMGPPFTVHRKVFLGKYAIRIVTYSLHMRSFFQRIIKWTFLVVSYIETFYLVLRISKTIYSTHLKIKNPIKCLKMIIVVAKNLNLSVTSSLQICFWP